MRALVLISILLLIPVATAVSDVSFEVDGQELTFASLGQEVDGHLVFTKTDGMEMVRVISSNIQPDGGKIAGIAACTRCRIPVTLLLEEEVQLRFEESVGNNAQPPQDVSLGFDVDNEGPSITRIDLNGCENACAYSDAHRNLSFLVSDSRSGVDNDGITVTINGQEYPATCEPQVQRSSCSLEIPGNDEAEITITARDRVGKTTTAEMSAHYDNQRPRIREGPRVVGLQANNVPGGQETHLQVWVEEPRSATVRIQSEAANKTGQCVREEREGEELLNCGVKVNFPNQRWSGVVSVIVSDDAGNEERREIRLDVYPSDTNIEPDFWDVSAAGMRSIDAATLRVSPQLYPVRLTFQGRPGAGSAQIASIALEGEQCAWADAAGGSAALHGQLTPPPPGSRNALFYLKLAAQGDDAMDADSALFSGNITCKVRIKTRQGGVIYAQAEQEEVSFTPRYVRPPAASEVYERERLEARESIQRWQTALSTTDMLIKTVGGICALRGGTETGAASLSLAAAGMQAASALTLGSTQALVEPLVRSSSRVDSIADKLTAAVGPYCHFVTCNEIQGTPYDKAWSAISGGESNPNAASGRNLDGASTPPPPQGESQPQTGAPLPQVTGPVYAQGAEPSSIPETSGLDAFAVADTITGRQTEAGGDDPQPVAGGIYQEPSVEPVEPVGGSGDNTGADLDLPSLNDIEDGMSILGGADSARQLIDPYKSIFVAGATMCAPAIQYHLNQQLVNKCVLENCLANSPETGASLSECRYQYTQTQCRYWTGSAYYALPWTNMFGTVTGILEDALSNPFFLFGLADAAICGATLGDAEEAMPWPGALACQIIDYPAKAMEYIGQAQMIYRNYQIITGARGAAQDSCQSLLSQAPLDGTFTPFQWDGYCNGAFSTYYENGERYVVMDGVVGRCIKKRDDADVAEGGVNRVEGDLYGCQTAVVDDYEVEERALEAHEECVDSIELPAAMRDARNDAVEKADELAELEEEQERRRNAENDAQDAVRKGSSDYGKAYSSDNPYLPSPSEVRDFLKGVEQGEHTAEQLDEVFTEDAGMTEAQQEQYAAARQAVEEQARHIEDAREDPGFITDDFKRDLKEKSKEYKESLRQLEREALRADFDESFIRRSLNSGIMWGRLGGAAYDILDYHPSGGFAGLWGIGESIGSVRTGLEDAINDKVCSNAGSYDPRFGQSGLVGQGIVGGRISAVATDDGETHRYAIDAYIRVPAQESPGNATIILQPGDVVIAEFPLSRAYVRTGENAIAYESDTAHERVCIAFPRPLRDYYTMTRGGADPDRRTLCAQIEVERI